MTVRYVVTFEFDSAPPITHRGTVRATTAATCFARAVRSATTAHPGLHWSSLVCVLLERVPDPPDPLVRAVRPARPRPGLSTTPDPGDPHA